MARPVHVRRPNAVAKGEAARLMPDGARVRQLTREADQLALADRITRTIAHEVRNPLTNMRLALELLHDEMKAERKSVQPYLDILNRNVDRIEQLIVDILGVGHKREVDLVPCLVNDLINDVMSNIADRLDLRDIIGEVELPEDPPTVFADPELMTLAITNIAVNAIEAMEPGKGLLRLAVRSTMDGVVIDVSDNGKGIPPESIPKLFEPFYSDRPGGMGLGLTTARSLLLSQHVLLDVQSTVGKGSTFSLQFPATSFA